jgi:endogenous inhibitor of DNA gyrase (YacG/DUF329 family)
MCQAELDAENLPETRPFCSPRCKKVDLHNWLEGVYRLPRDIEPDELADLPEDQQNQVLSILFGQDTKPPVH